MACLLQDVPDDVLARVLSWLEPSTAAALGGSCTGLRNRICPPSPSSPPLPINWAWRGYCRARWGRHVAAEEAHGAAVGAPPPPNWHRYYTFRSSWWTAPPSPLGLLQERFARDPWRLVAACILCSRTTGGPTVHATVGAFFDAYPSPSALLDADTPTLAALLHPLGLHRERTLVKTAAGFLSTAWTGGTARDLFGCGAFVDDSWAVFTRGLAHARRVARDGAADRNVRAYAAWVVRQADARGPPPAAAASAAAAAPAAVLPVVSPAVPPQPAAALSQSTSGQQQPQRGAQQRGAAAAAASPPATKPPRVTPGAASDGGADGGAAARRARLEARDAGGSRSLSGGVAGMKRGREVAPVPTPAAAATAAAAAVAAAAAPRSRRRVPSAGR